MKYFSKILNFAFLFTFIIGCTDDTFSPLTDINSSGEDLTAGSLGNQSRRTLQQPKVTGEVEIEWMGDKGMGSTMGNQPEEMLAFAGFDAFVPTGDFQLKEPSSTGY